MPAAPRALARPYAPRVPELRHDRLTGELVLFAPTRSTRPHTTAASATAESGSEHCPFCPGHEGETPPEISRTGTGAPGTPGWRRRVFPNLYPIVGGSDAASGATGAHEVVVLAPEHDHNLARLDDGDAVEVFEVLRDRARAHAEAGRAYVQVVVNEGRAAGASIAHPHAQVLALDFVPPAVAAASRRFAEAGRDLVVGDHALARRDGTAVTADRVAPTWCGTASGSPFEARVAALGSGGRFAHCTDAELAAVGQAVPDALRRLATVLGRSPYNVVVHDAPTGGEGPYHWWVQIVPRLEVRAGFELGTGLSVQSVDPVAAASRLREARPPC